MKEIAINNYQIIIIDDVFAYPLAYKYALCTKHVATKL